MDIKKTQDEINRLDQIQTLNHNFELPNGLTTSRTSRISSNIKVVKKKKK